MGLWPLIEHQRHDWNWRNDDSLDFIVPEKFRNWRMGGGYECTFCRKWSRKPFEAQIGGNNPFPCGTKYFCDQNCLKLYNTGLGNYMSGVPTFWSFRKPKRGEKK